MGLEKGIKHPHPHFKVRSSCMFRCVKAQNNHLYHNDTIITYFVVRVECLSFRNGQDLIVRKLCIFTKLFLKDTFCWKLVNLIKVHLTNISTFITFYFLVKIILVPSQLHFTQFYFIHVVNIRGGEKGCRFVSSKFPYPWL